VTFEPLTHGECSDTDWSIDRLVNDGAYADGNLVVMSTKANKAKAALDRLSALLPGPHAAATGRCLVGPQCTPLAPRVMALPHQVIQNELVYRLTGAALCERILQPFRKLGGKEANKLFRKIEKKIEKRAPRLPRSQWRKACPFNVWLDPHLFEAFCEWRSLVPPGAADALLRGMRNFAGMSAPEATRSWAIDRRGYAT
jgi:hypothetical protein